MGKSEEQTRQRPSARGSRTRSAFVFLGLLLFIAVTTATAATFTASLDRDTITLGESATLSLACGGGQPQTEPAPPEVPNLQIAYVGPSSQFSVINGQVSSSITYIFRVTPRQPGDFTIPAIATELGGEKLTSQPLHLKVLKPTAPPPAAVSSGAQLAFLKFAVPKKEAYTGEALTVQLQLYLSGRVQNVGNFQITGFPAEGFNVGKMVEGQRRQVQVGNGIYTVIPLNYGLTALKAGTYTLGPITASVLVEVASANRRRDPLMEQFGIRDPFDRFNVERQQVALTTDPEQMQLLPLPRENAPTNYNGAVGSYTMSVTAGPTNLAEGDPLTLKVQISGRGAIDAVNLSDTALPGFKTLSQETKVDTVDQMGFQGTKTFERILTPDNSDVKALPVISFSFFDPDQKSYKTLTHPPIPLVVRPGGSAPVPSIAASPRSKQETPPVVQDIVPNKQRLGSLGQIGAPLAQQTWFLALQGAPVLAFISAVLWRRRVENLANNPRLRRQRQVAQTIREGLSGLKQLAAENSSDEFFASVFRLIQEQLGERLDLPASAITEAVIEERLRPRGVPNETLAPLAQLFQTCNQARYAPIKTSEELVALVPRVEFVLGQLAKIPV